MKTKILDEYRLFLLRRTLKREHDIAVIEAQFGKVGSPVGKMGHVRDYCRLCGKPFVTLVTPGLGDHICGDCDRPGGPEFRGGTSGAADPDSNGCWANMVRAFEESPRNFIAIAIISILLISSVGFAHTDDQLWSAICQVESGGKSDAIGDGGKAVGVAQIWPITVKDCNRIIGREEYSLADRLSPERSREMFFIITRHYCGKNYTAERAARVWNGGPRGFNKKSTITYWNKVKSHLEK